jgi:5-methyltetrahydropteroyltriglutamate--homocysteine methyltransferase
VGDADAAALPTIAPEDAGRVSPALEREDARVTFTATADLMLPATVIGSWPRPSWFTESMWGRPLDTAMMDARYREQFSDALAVVISEQQRAGLDILTNGDYFLDADFAGRSWHHYPLQRWLGLEHDELQPADTRSPILGDQQGTLLQEIYTSWRWPIVTGKIRANPRNPLEYAKIWRMAQVRATKPVKFGTVSGQVMALFLDSHTPEYAREDGTRQIIWDMATAINKELRELAASGCKIIQVEEPTIHFTSAYTPEDRDTLEFLVDALNHEISGLEGVEVWIHTCWGNPMMQRVFDQTSYRDAVELYLDRVNCDVWTVEMKDRGGTDLELFGGWRETLTKKIAIGAVSHRQLQVDRPEEVAAEVRRAAEYIDLDKLIVSSDCGFGREGLGRGHAFYKSAALAIGANIVRREQGLPETYVPAADEQLAMDYVPATYEE